MAGPQSHDNASPPREGSLNGERPGAAAGGFPLGFPDCRPRLRLRPAAAEPAAPGLTRRRDLVSERAAEPVGDRDRAGLPPMKIQASASGSRWAAVGIPSAWARRGSRPRRSRAPRACGAHEAADLLVLPRLGDRLHPQVGEERLQLARRPRHARRLGVPTAASVDGPAAAPTPRRGTRSRARAWRRSAGTASARRRRPRARSRRSSRPRSCRSRRRAARRRRSPRRSARPAGA